MTDAQPRLSREFFARPVLEVARDLVGKVLVSMHDGVETSGRIVETEGYAGMADPASHAVRLRRSRERMGGEPGLAYVHRSYGLHNTLNVVTEPIGTPTAVLIRALEPLSGFDIMRRRRGAPDRIADERLAAGPGNLTQALAITLPDDGRDLTSDPLLYLLDGPPVPVVWESTRIGLTKAVELPWRFFDPASRSISAHRRGREVT